MNIKYCKKCKSVKIKKNGKRSGEQRYLCNKCGYSWVLSKCKISKEIESDKLFEIYVKDDLKYPQIALTLNVSKRTIQRILGKADFKKIIVIQ